MKDDSNFGDVRLTKGSNAVGVGVGLALAFLFAFCWPHLAGASTTANVSISRGLPFAIADFDGDQQPDLASVQLGETRSSSGNYVVRFRFSTLGGRYVRVTAPGGGLLVQARDVNGDQLPDLVVASAWRDRPVVILLNKGDGNFSQVDPANYPEVLRSSAPGWNTSRTRYSSAFGLPRRSSTGDISLASCTEARDANQEGPDVRPIRPALARALTLRAPRAPPSATAL